MPEEGVRENLQNFFVLMNNGKLIGTVGLEIYGDKALLRSLAVASNYQGKGYGNQHYQAAIEKERQ
ncbi:MAG: GNAT family N-acetyltransferase, partial [Calditrichia bacterium]